MIKLTDVEGQAIWVNPRLVIWVSEVDGRTAMMFAGDAFGYTYVAEPAEDVAALFDAALS